MRIEAPDKYASLDTDTVIQTVIQTETEGDEMIPLLINMEQMKQDLSTHHKKMLQ